MCNIVDLGCEWCDTIANVHIADFCVPAEEVKMYCYRHRALVAESNLEVFTEIDSKGGAWTFTAPQGAYGICLNGDPWAGEG